MQNKFISFTYSIAIITCLLFSPPTTAMQAEHSAIEDLFHAGTLFDWDTDFAALERENLTIALELKLAGKSSDAEAQLFSCARHGSASAMYHLGLLAKPDNQRLAFNWFKLAILIHFQKTGQLMKLAANALLPEYKLISALKNHREAKEPTLQKGPNAKLTDSLARLVNNFLQQDEIDLANYHQKERWEAVEKQTERWWINKPAIRKRVHTFVILCAPPSMLQHIYSKDLRFDKTLPSLETMLLTERCLKKAFVNYSPSLNIPHEGLLYLLKDVNFECIKALYHTQPQGFLDITDRDEELLRRIETVSSPYYLYKLGVLFYYGGRLDKRNEAERKKSCADCFVRADNEEAHAMLAQLYSEGILGNELSEDEKLLAMLKHSELAGYRDIPLRNRISILIRLRRIDEAVLLAKDLLTKNYRDKGFLSMAIAFSLYSLDLARSRHNEVTYPHAEEIIIHAKIALSLGYQLAQTFLDILDGQNTKATGNDDKNSDENEIDSFILPSTTTTTGAEPRMSRRENKIAKKERRTRERQAEMANILLTFTSSTAAPRPFTYPVRFANKDVEKDFANLAHDKKKSVDELFVDIMNAPWELHGKGNPEILKRHGKYGGLMSRMINSEDRLVYDFFEGAIIIHACVGHYE